MAVSYTQLKAFHAVALTKSFTRAANSVGMSQPGVSDQVRRLEERYGVKLFIRAHRTISLTEKGEQLFKLTSKLFAMEADIERLMQSRSSDERLTLAVDSPRHLSAFLAVFRQLYPVVKVSLSTGNSEENVGKLLSRKADVAVVGHRLKSPELEDRRLESTMLNMAPILIMCARCHPWSQRAGSKDGICIAELNGQPLVMREHGSATRQLVEAALASRGVKPGPILEATGREAVSDLVADDLGVGFISAAESYSDMRLIFLPIRDAEITMHENLVWHRDCNSCTELFVKLILDERYTLFPDGWVH